LGCPVGQHILIKVPDAEGQLFSRPYIPITNDEQHLGVFDIVVKTTSESPMIEYLLGLQSGDMAPISGPVGTFIYNKNAFSQIGMIASGLGLMPMLQIIRYAMHSADDLTIVSLIYINKKESNILFREELDHLAKSCVRFHIYYVIEHPASGDPTPGITKCGGVDREILFKYLPSCNTEGTSLPIKILVCGAPKVKELSSTYLTTLGYSPNQVHYF